MSPRFSVTLAALTAILAGCGSSNDEMANTPPTITGIASATVDEDTVVGPLSFLVSDSTTPAQGLNVTASTNNAAVCPQGGILLQGAPGANRFVTVTPAEDAVGSCTIALNVTDREGLTASTSLNLTFREVRVSFTSLSKSTFNGSPDAVPADINRVKFDFPDNEDNAFQAYQELLPR